MGGESTVSETSKAVLIPPGYILGMGNPLLDMTAEVTEDFLQKYDLKTCNAILAEPKHEPIYGELVKGDYEISYLAGGSTQNSIRVAQWIGQSPDSTVFVGSIGKDSSGEKLVETCFEGGVRPMYYESADRPTGACAVLVLDHERTMVTKLEAANDYKHAHTLKEEIQNVIQAAQIFYSASFFVTVPEGPESMLSIAEHACKNNKIYSLNFSATFLIEFFSDSLNKLLPYTDFVFSNELEAACFGTSLNWGTNLENIALKLADWPKENTNRKRVVVITRGSQSTIVAEDGKATEYPVPPLAEEKMIDTCGAGDAFVGAFLACVAKGEPIGTCVNTGHWAAQVVIQQHGCDFPKKLTPPKF